MPTGDLELPNEANGGMLCANAAFEWFEYMLKGKPYSHKLGTIEAYQIQGEKYVEYENDLTVEETVSFHLAANGKLESSVPSEASTVEYIYDP